MIDVFTFGEAMIRFSTPPGHSLETAPTFDLHVGGAEANVAASQHVWDDASPGYGRYRMTLSSVGYSRKLRAAGVDCSVVKTVTDGRVGTYVADRRSDPATGKNFLRPEAVRPPRCSHSMTSPGVSSTRPT